MTSTVTPTGGGDTFGRTRWSPKAQLPVLVALLGGDWFESADIPTTWLIRLVLFCHFAISPFRALGSIMGYCSQLSSHIVTKYHRLSQFLMFSAPGGQRRWRWHTYIKPLYCMIVVFIVIAIKYYTCGIDLVSVRSSVNSLRDFCQTELCARQVVAIGRSLLEYILGSNFQWIKSPTGMCKYESCWLK